jgi:hypothetical protein
MRLPYSAGPDKQITLMREVERRMWVTDLGSRLVLGSPLVHVWWERPRPSRSTPFVDS